MNIAIVEDESLTSLFITETLEDLGHSVVGNFDNGIEMLEMASMEKIDLVFMDIEINGKMDGIECAVKLDKQYNIPSVFISSYQNSSTIRDAMDASPLGYLIKPVNESDIEAALAVASRILKKSIIEESSVVTIDAYSYDFQKGTLNYKNELVKLSKNEYKVVHLLFKSHGNIVDSSELIRYIWEEDYDREESLRELIYRLRRKLPDLSIRSLSKAGYSIARSSAL